MKTLQMTREEVIAMFNEDREVDHMTDPSSDLSAEQRKAQSTYSKTVDRKKPNYTFKKRERKPKPTKRSIIAELAKFMDDESETCPESVTISNPECEITFVVNGVNYSVKLIEHRPPKAK